jgi:TIR domain
MSTDFTGNGSIGNLIFLSYRRLDTTPQTLALKLELERNLSAVQVFMDNSVMAGGEKFPDEINNALGAASLVIVVMGKEWFGESTDKKSRKKRRIDDSKDWVFREVQFALEAKHGALLPVLIDDAPEISEFQLPRGLKDLSNINAIRITTSRWKSDTPNLIDLLEKRFQFTRNGKEAIFQSPTH